MSSPAQSKTRRNDTLSRACESRCISPTAQNWVRQRPPTLNPGEAMDITLTATEEAFETWSAHPEVGDEEANHQSDRE